MPPGFGIIEKNIQIWGPLRVGRLCEIAWIYFARAGKQGL
jgi:hypothetical protein